jgi:ATP-dependent Clp protease ATP-binding subunit ClpA
MFDQFTPPARAALESTMGIAIGLGHNYIGTEHLLLALIGAEALAGGGPLTERGVTRDAAEREIQSLLASHLNDAQALRAVGVDPQALQTGAERLGVGVSIRGLPGAQPAANVPQELSRLTPRTRTVLAMAERASPDDVTCNDLLAAMLDEDAGLALFVLERLGVSLPELRAEVAR